MKSKTIFQILTPWTLALALASPQALACTFHLTSFGSFFEKTYPGSMSVAAAVASARTEQRLKATPLENGDSGLSRASIELQALGRRLDLVREAPRTDFFLILAGQQLWTYYRLTSLADRETYGVHVHTMAPVHEVPVVVTSYYVVHALRGGDMTFSEARDLGLIQIRDDADGHVTALFAAAFGMQEQAFVAPPALRAG